MIKEFSAIAFLLLSGCAASAPDDETVSRISVSFETGARYLPEPMKLNIRVTDVDLAGDSNCSRSANRPSTHHQRSLPAAHHA